MPTANPSPAGAPKAADADLLGEAATLQPPGAADSGEGAMPAAEPTSAMPEPPPAEDENQPGFIGERNRPAP